MFGSLYSSFILFVLISFQLNLRSVLWFKCTLFPCDLFTIMFECVSVSVSECVSFVFWTYLPLFVCVTQLCASTIYRLCFKCVFFTFILFYRSTCFFLFLLRFFFFHFLTKYNNNATRTKIFVIVYWVSMLEYCFFIGLDFRLVYFVRQQSENGGDFIKTKATPFLQWLYHSGDAFFNYIVQLIDHNYTIHTHSHTYVHESHALSHIVFMPIHYLSMIS